MDNLRRNIARCGAGVRWLSRVTRWPSCVTRHVTLPGLATQHLSPLSCPTVPLLVTSDRLHLFLLHISNSVYPEYLIHILIIWSLKPTQKNRNETVAEHQYTKILLIFLDTMMQWQWCMWCWNCRTTNTSCPHYNMKLKLNKVFLKFT